MFIDDDTRKRLENIVKGIVLEGKEDTCTAARNLLCASFRTSTTVKQDFESQSRIKKEQADLGFIEKENALLAVLSQPFIASDASVDLEDVKKLLAFNGFINSKRNDYFNKELGLILEDMHDENIIVNSNTLFFIDTVFYTVSE